ncbi:MAG: hypothetical protein IPK16_27270 [Anaerolineales bacterium]|nr:hypothetical protein [Anaerolineales bacterium]
MGTARLLRRIAGLQPGTYMIFVSISQDGAEGWSVTPMGRGAVGRAGVGVSPTGAHK